jgi:hypothetical protein
VALVLESGEYGPSPYPLEQLAGYRRLKRGEGGEMRSVDVVIKVAGLAKGDVTIAATEERKA